ncbi:hypothetical protein [Fibrella aquatilis]|uniref:Uncharacterized protein n=1 Tax=Fibrella aquatilis TaxID=2817059 RepID=A0A939G8W4_9BACT|nr:hypothetical protein [Fibrella aquatilis]MBO0934602.1 hypothetical protein [Fibrella aquatilis]
MATTFKKISPLNINAGAVPTATRQGIRLNKPADMLITKQNKQAHVHDADVLATGVEYIDENPGIGSVVAAANRSTCLTHDIVKAYCQARNTGVPNLTPAQCQELALELATSRRRTDGSDPGAGFLSSQMGEGASSDNDPYYITRNANSLLIEKLIGEYQDGKGWYYVGGYDGAVRFEGLMSNWLSLSDVASDAATLNWLRTKGASFGNLAFQPHNAGGVSYRGQALYMTPLVQMYVQANFPASYIVAQTAFGIAACRAGLRALAEEKDTNGNYYHTQAQRDKINARRICLFTWNALTAGVGGPNEFTRVAVPNGYVQGNTFASNSWAMMRGVNAVAFLEQRCSIIDDWDDTSKFDHQPRAYAPTYNESGVDMGFFGTGNPPTAQPAYEYKPDNVLVAYPVQPKGTGDVIYDAEDLAIKVRDWVGRGKVFSYASVKGQGDADFCPTYDDRAYVVQRHRAKRSWGYVAYDATKNRAAYVHLNYNIAPHKTENVQVQINGQNVDLGAVNGSQTTFFAIQF